MCSFIKKYWRSVEVLEGILLTDGNEKHLGWKGSESKGANAVCAEAAANRRIRRDMDEHGSVIADWLHSLAAYSNSVEVLQTLGALCKELIEMSHR